MKVELISEHIKPEVIAIVGVVKGGGTGVLGAPNPIPQKENIEDKRVRKKIKVPSLTTLYTNEECQRRGNWV